MNTYIYCNSNALAKVDNTINYITARNVAFVQNAQFIEFLFEHTSDNSFIDITHPKINKNIKLIDIYDGLLIIPSPKTLLRTNPKILFEKTLSFMGEQLHFSVITNSEIKLRISGYYKTLEIPLNDVPTSLDIYPHNELPFVVSVMKGKKTSVVAFDIKTFSCVFQKQCDSIEINDYIKLTTNHDNIIKHTTIDRWKVGSPFSLYDRQVSHGINFINSQLVCYAFLEEIRLGGDYSRFLSENLKEKASLIPEFLQDFKIVLPPINQNFPNTITLVYENKVKYLIIKHDDLINDICLESYPIN